MDDLISRRAILEELKDYSDMNVLDFEAEAVLRWIVDMINEQPTAYDVEKVVAELEELKEKSLSSYACDEMKTAIDIVRKGGVE